MIERRTPLKRSPPPVRRKRPNAKRPAPRRVSVLRDRDYLDWLAERRCVACAILHDRHPQKPAFYVLCDPAHGPVNGMRSKGPDDGAIPLCQVHHKEQHAIGWPAFENKYGFSREQEAAAHYALYLVAKD